MTPTAKLLSSYMGSHENLNPTKITNHMVCHTSYTCDKQLPFLRVIYYNSQSLLLYSVKYTGKRTLQESSYLSAISFKKQPQLASQLDLYIKVHNTASYIYGDTIFIMMHNFTQCNTFPHCDKTWLIVTLFKYFLTHSGDLLPAICYPGNQMEPH